LILLQQPAASGRLPEKYLLRKHSCLRAKIACHAQDGRQQKTPRPIGAHHHVAAAESALPPAANQTGQHPAQTGREFPPPALTGSGATGMFSAAQGSIPTQGGGL